MKRIAAFARWLVDHWYVPLFFVGAVAGFVLGRRRPSAGHRTPLEDVRREVRVIRAGRDAKLIEAEHGVDEAMKRIDDERRGKIDELDDEQRARLDRLADDPRARARWLERLG